MPKISLTKALLMSAGAAVVALLFAPKPGKELRKELLDKAEELKETGEEKANELVQDFKESYAEVERELEAEQAKMDAKQAQLNQTIEEIERDLSHNQVKSSDERVVDPATASHAVYANEDEGNVQNTPLEPTEDQAIPADKVEDALKDNALSDDEDFEVDTDNLADEADASTHIKPNT